jgi:NADH-quinone oxidoreductase subunit M
MNLFEVPWLELAVVVPLAGAVIARRQREPLAAWRSALATSLLTLLCSLLAWVAHATGRVPGGVPPHDMLDRLPGGRHFAIDNLNAPLVPLVALLHLLVVAGTTGGKAVRLSFGGLLIAESVQLATFAAAGSIELVTFLALGTVQPFLELSERGASTRVYRLHMGLFALLLVAGLALGRMYGVASPLAWSPIAAAVLLRCGIAPGHLWARDLFTNATFGTAILFLAPLTGVYAAVRLLDPVCPTAALQLLGIWALVAGVYSASLAVVQSDARRFAACLWASNTAIVLAGVTLVSRLGVAAGLAIWVSASISLTGVGFALRAVESRIGELSLDRFHGFYERVPALAVIFLLCGLGSIGFPGTVGFLPTEVLVERMLLANLLAGIGIVLAVALNGFAVLRTYSLVFTGRRHESSIPLGVTRRERFTILLLVGLVLGGGLVPQLLLQSRQQAAEFLFDERARQASHVGETKGMVPSH